MDIEFEYTTLAEIFQLVVNVRPLNGVRSLFGSAIKIP